jgi:hypothetical protein
VNYPPYFNNPNDPNDPHSQPTTAGQYPQWGQPGQPSSPQWGPQTPPPPPPQFPQQPGQFSQSGQNFPQYPQPYPQPGQFGPPPVQQSQKPPKPPWWDVNARKAYYKQYPLSKKQQLGIGCGTLIGILLLCSMCSAIANAGNSTKQTATAPVSSPIATQAQPTQEPTATATPSPTPTPTPTPTPEPTQPPVQQSQPVQQSKTQQPAPPPAQLFVNFTGASAVDNSYGSVSVHTLPSAALTISVKYCSGSYATSKSLQGTEYADSSGNYTWNWTPNTKCKGTATAYVTASLNGQSASNSTDFTVS